MKLHEADRLLHISEKDTSEFLLPPDYGLDQLSKGEHIDPRTIVQHCNNITQPGTRISHLEAGVLTASLWDGLIVNSLRPGLAVGEGKKLVAERYVSSQCDDLATNLPTILKRLYMQMLAERRVSPLEITSGLQQADKMAFAIRKLVISHIVANKALSQLISNPTKQPDPNIHQRHIGRMVKVAADIKIDFETIRKRNDISPIKDDIVSTEAGLLHEIDSFLALSSFCQAHSIPAYILPVCWILESAHKVSGQYMPPLDYIVYRPDTKSVFGVQSGLSKVPDKRDEGIVLTINASDIGNIERNEIVPGRVLSAFNVADGGIDLENHRRDRQDKLVDFSTAASLKQNKKQAREEVKKIRAGIHNAIRHQIPGLLDQVA